MLTKTGGSILLAHNPPKWVNFACRFTSQEVQTLGKFVVNFALPALILRAVSTQPIGEFANVGYFGAVLIGSLVVFWSGYYWSRRAAGESASASAFSAMGMSCANSGFVGFPVLLIALPDVASKALALNMIIENLVMIPTVLMTCSPVSPRL